MLHMDNFLKYFIMTFLTLFLCINVVYAFNLTNSLGVPIVFQNDGSNYSQYYFGVSNLIDSYQAFFQSSSILSDCRWFMSQIFNTMNALNIQNLMGFEQNWGVDAGSDILSFFSAIFNIFVNVPYTIMVVIYFLMFLIYILMIIFTFLSYVMYLLNGAFRTTLPNTDFPDIEDIVQSINFILVH